MTEMRTFRVEVLGGRDNRRRYAWMLDADSAEAAVQVVVDNAPIKIERIHRVFLVDRRHPVIYLTRVPFSPVPPAPSVANLLY